MNWLFNRICHCWNVIFGKFNSELTKEKLLEITQKAVEEQGRKYRPPCSIETHIGYYSVRTNIRFRGSNAVIKIDSETGDVLELGFMDY